MKYIYIILLLLVIYYIYCRLSYTENFDSSYDPSFDPSLVPVSSIVTLAKIADKLVSNNQIMVPSDLTIVGNLTTNSTTILDDNAIITKNGITVTGPIKSTGNNNLSGPTTIKKNFTTNSLITANLNSNSTINSTQNKGIIFNSKYTIVNDSDNLKILNSTNNPILTFTPSGNIYQNSNTIPTVKTNSFTGLNDFAARNLNINKKLSITSGRPTLTIDDNIIQFGNGSDKILQFQGYAVEPPQSTNTQRTKSGVSMPVDSVGPVLMELFEENKSVSIPGTIKCNGRDFSKKHKLTVSTGSGTVCTISKSQTEYTNLFIRSFLIIYAQGSGKMNGNCWVRPGGCAAGWDNWSKGFNISIFADNFNTDAGKQISPTYSAGSNCGGCGNNGSEHNVYPSFKSKFLLEYNKHYNASTTSLTITANCDSGFNTSVFNLLEVC